SRGDPAAQSLSGGAVRAAAEDVDDVLRLGEAVLRRDAPGPGLDRLGVDPDGPAAVAADEVMVVPGGAGAVERFAALLQCIDVALGAEVGERPVDGREADLLAVVAESRVERLRTDEALAALERSPHRGALGGVPPRWRVAH